MKGRLIIGLSVLALIIVAVAVILATANRENLPPSSPGVNSPGIPVSPSEPVLPGPSDNVFVTPPETDEPPVTEAPPSETPVPAITGVFVQYAKAPLSGYDPAKPSEAGEFTLERGEGVYLTLKILPEGILEQLGITPVWTTSNAGACSVTPSSAAATAANVVWAGKGNATVTVTVGEWVLTIKVSSKS
jgi:hypothetical protein